MVYPPRVRSEAIMSNTPERAMSVEEALARVSPQRGMLLTIGVFDGVHLGHKHLLNNLTRLARTQRLSSGIITFIQHPEDIFRPDSKLPYLTDLQQRIALLKNEGVDKIITLPFTRETASISARQFVSLLIKHLKMQGLVIGADFTLGRSREGNADTLRQLGQEMGFSVEVVQRVTMNGEVVSSTAIRAALSRGDIKEFYRLAGRPFALKKPVVAGTGRGRSLGFPTANLDIEAGQALPADGVYASLAYIGDVPYQSMTYIGQRPTFDEYKRVVEVYLLDFQGNLYGCELKIEIVARLRPDKKFSSPEELSHQINRDIEEGRLILESRSKDWA